MFQRFAFPSAILLITALGASAQQADSPVQLTIYNQDFAVARTSVPLNLHSGSNDVLTTDVTSQLEPDSVVLRDPTSHHAFKVAEQNYDAGIVTQNWLLTKYEGKTLDFQIYSQRILSKGDDDSGHLAPPMYVKGRIIRAGEQPLIEVDGHLQFQLPGMPVFPADTQGLLLKPTLRWQIESKDAAKFPAELDYITHGLSWQATYNVVIPEAVDVTGPELAEIVGWVSIQNNSGTDFPKATIQLMAGDVAKIQELRAMGGPLSYGISRNGLTMDGLERVTQKEFDDFHLYDLHRTTALPNRETKQVQFLDVAGISVQRSYQFDGNAEMIQNYYPGYHVTQRDYGNAPITHVAIQQEIKNSVANHLGMPLPAGRMRLYRREATGQMQFVGESMVKHTPAEQTIRMVSGLAFDVTAERRQTDFRINEAAHVIDEVFEIKVHNQKAQPVVVHDVEHLYRAANWEITGKSAEFTKKNSTTIDFPLTVPAKGDATLTYTVHYTW